MSSPCASEYFYVFKYKYKKYRLSIKYVLNISIKNDKYKCVNSLIQAHGSPGLCAGGNLCVSTQAWSWHARSLARLQEEAGEEREREFGRESGEIPGPYTQDQANGRSGYLRAGRFSTHFEVLTRRWHVSYTCWQELTAFLSALSCGLLHLECLGPTANNCAELNHLRRICLSENITCEKLKIGRRCCVVALPLLPRCNFKMCRKWTCRYEPSVSPRMVGLRTPSL